ncbi:MAG TPA: secondary thiamine-phosphate synthase enzyme YjbQ [Gammaproteobacteria bacterium]
MAFQRTLAFETPGRGTVEITGAIQDVVRDSGVETGLCNLFIHHTSASLLLTENADPQVRRDLETFLARLAPDGDPMFRHDDEGPDDMPAHVRTVLTESALSVPVTAGRLALGTWQGIYLYEHRHGAHQRRVTVTVLA